MTLISAAEVADLQDLWADTLDTTCVLTHYARVADAAGGYTETTTTSTVACRVQPADVRAVELVDAARVMGVDYFDIALPHGTVVGAQDTITSGGYTYQVVGTTTGRSIEYGITARCTRAV